jgi:hypothetical protein
VALFASNRTFTFGGSRLPPVFRVQVRGLRGALLNVTSSAGGPDPSLVLCYAPCNATHRFDVVTSIEPLTASLAIFRGNDTTPNLTVSVAAGTLYSVPVSAVGRYRLVWTVSDAAQVPIVFTLIGIVKGAPTAVLDAVTSLTGTVPFSVTFDVRAARACACVCRALT